MPDNKESDSYQKEILLGLNRVGRLAREGFRQVYGVKHIYGGTANPNKVAKTHAKNKIAKASRKANR